MGNSAPPSTEVFPCRIPFSGKMPTIFPLSSRAMAVRSAPRSLFVRSMGKTWPHFIIRAQDRDFDERLVRHEMDHARKPCRQVGGDRRG